MADVAWVGVGLGTAILGVVVLYWRDIKRFILRREKIVVSEQQVPPKLDISLDQIISGTLAWLGCKRYTYFCPDGVSGVIWAQSDEAAMVVLNRSGCADALLNRTAWAQPKEGDIVVYDEEVYPCTE